MNSLRLQFVGITICTMCNFIYLHIVFKNADTEIVLVSSIVMYSINVLLCMMITYYVLCKIRFQCKMRSLGVHELTEEYKLHETKRSIVNIFTLFIGVYIPYALALPLYLEYDTYWLVPVIALCSIIGFFIQFCELVEYCNQRDQQYNLDESREVEVSTPPPPERARITNRWTAWLTSDPDYLPGYDE